MINRKETVISEFSRRIIDSVKSGEIRDRDQLQAFKVRLCHSFCLDAVPPNSDILAYVNEDERKLLGPFLVKKPMRTMSGVAVVAVMTEPHPCPHGKCSYCPGGIDSPQSYTGKEPAARRAERNRFDPYDQVSDRLNQLNEIGHETDKIDLIIMGGTFTSRELEYQEWFVRRCLDAMNGIPSDSLDSAQSLNETAEHRCIGLTVETRPDVFTTEQIEHAMAMGATRVELGVQILDDKILEDAERGHGIDAVIRATREVKEHGLKVCYHIMPGLPGSTPEKDLECFERIFKDPDFRPDMLKFYPTLVVSGTKLYDLWNSGGYVPYDADTAVELLSNMKSIVPEYVRIQRIQRDIPVPQITAGIMKSNLRQLVQDNMAHNGLQCRCIRCREVGHTGAVLTDPSLVTKKVTEYDASGGKERFISLEYEDSIVGYARLRTDAHVTIRELKVFGKTAPIGTDGEDWQHRGFGKELVADAERYAMADGFRSIRVTSGIGVRKYYGSLGYRLEGPYMVKDLS
ncbi:MAG: tRNA uridine(34) 5-carboxymethylaminomethyl modification radical SAM/GNAT enzyme Elp3 [Candidatus Methanoplasma sp.]|jgi:elongator complex protein 3|nr:tRNA uridine(34) 5-carboxymethylaminomethyl modification radical SAM/GNAT enzyme Elp3 [Candidatus Methanoplasma sp.]